MKKFGTSQLAFWVLGVMVLLFGAGCMRDDLEVDNPATTNEPAVEPENTFPASAVTDCSSCDFIVNTYITDGNQLGIKPGDVVCLKAGLQDRAIFRNIQGTPENPVIIRNCDGVASIYSTTGFGLKFEHCKNFKLM